MVSLDGKRVVVIGAGRSGRAAAECLHDAGARVLVLDRSPDTLADGGWPAGVERSTGQVPGAGLDGVELIVPSPGVAPSHPLLRAALARGVPVWGELELAARLLSCPLLAVTGTNGKSTTTVLLGAMLKAAGGRVFVGGNLGTPLSEATRAREAYDAAVVEVSSFQLEWIEHFRARVAVWLNLTPDHLDRYSDVNSYCSAKARLLQTQCRGDTAVLNRDDPRVWGQRESVRGSLFSFGRAPVDHGAFLDGDDILVVGAGPRRRFPLADSPLLGEHNRENLLAATAAATVWGVPPDAITAAMRATRGLPHRLELVREHGGVRYYDDSKGTNTGAVCRSLESFPAGVFLLLGGRDKSGDFQVLRSRLSGRVRRVFCFGEAAPVIAAQLDGAAECAVMTDLAAAVRAAAVEARPGDTVLLSPGCASFDEFRDYAERGRRFCEMVEAL